jgi:ferritin-like metal-binding protein YciE
MADLNERDAKLVQYLVEAHGKERELETALKAHIELTTKMPYKKRLRKHLTETRDHANRLERRIKQLGGADELGGVAANAQAVAGKTVALAKGPLHALRGTSEQETMLKNAKTEYFNEAEEIATYTAIEALAEKVGDKETAKLARSIKSDEQRMAKFLEGQIISLAKAVATDEVPAKQRGASASRPKAKAPRKRVAATA